MSHIRGVNRGRDMNKRIQSFVNVKEFLVCAKQEKSYLVV